MSPTPADLAELAVTAAHDAADLVRTQRAGGVAVAGTKSSDIDVVTAADRASEQLIRERILGRRPTDSFLGEEGDDILGTSGVRWVVDPIDGTVNYLYGLPGYAVSIAAEVDGAAVAGVVVDVLREITYVGHLDPEAGPTGGVALRDGRPIGVRAPAPLGQRLIATGFNYVTEVRAVQAAGIARLLPQVRDIRRMGSCALDLCAVAEGTLDGYVEEGVHRWDHAAAGLIARLAGARLEMAVGAAGTEAVVCGPDHGFEALWDAVRRAGLLRE